MRLSNLLAALSLVSIAYAAVTNKGPSKRPPGHHGPWPPAVCNPKAKGPHLEAQQKAAFVDYTYLLTVKHDILTAYNRWVPGQYINHNPFAESGREFAIAFLKPYHDDPNFITTNVTSFAGGGYGFIHLKLFFPDQPNPVVSMDYFRFEGTCIVEHWDVGAEITGDEPNPIAYF
ncbi:hypothetical protein CC1G_08237 [Coprinopsis cinerea okayama7|uniref:SnoaL-like domain-containing protein n=1 Tax=Coprinopsis cinerea (strain Okayama-7 / 130 / ATCC MYA-4618 / FGSC 9003) TaxID=240176 RepID=A8P7I8_COPC7|nr:hypothetical protein CC1G_08237 [Coprinopsis cinerea okayama7\|eukprot:XP_001839370.1 hypothetical protein CC1G_08237 [Coprinopsis cinerea okayama7\